ncbi:hypothetical protein EW145_g5052 [Phellinidium pouzarii]|uniref:NADP-dependent oxidoreductase domain-containing protein n=1 Tax=Phellinidium pouzarii TaxID=167371 RepID=A0A4S4L1I9_9AGAM|nr:hypothetical protein EW145_g5052 [Phellinidium pouzarii]
MAAANVPSFQLNNGTSMPSVGLGCWMGTPSEGGEDVYCMVQAALKHGYRHIDTAFAYGNEKIIGKAIRESGVPREEIFVTTKLSQSYHEDVLNAFNESLKNFDIGYIDLYLMHWPQAFKRVKDINTVTVTVVQPEEHPTIIDTWLDMEKLLETGKLKSIGVSNFSIKTLEQLLAKATVTPVTNQVELHPCLPQNDLKEYCEGKGILLTAYSPIGNPDPEHMTLLQEPVVVEIAEKTKSSTGQVLISWAVQRGTAVIPKSAKEARIQQNIALVTLSEADMKALNEIHLKPGMHRSLARFHGRGKVFGWTYEQLGWSLDNDGAVINNEEQPNVVLPTAL